MREGKPLGHDADDGVAVMVERDVAADDVAIGAEDRLPGFMAQHHDVSSGLLLVAKKAPPHHGVDPQHAEEIGADGLRLQLPGSAFAGQGVVVVVIRGERLEGMIARAPVKEIRIAEAVSDVGLARRSVQHQRRHQAVRLGKRQRAQQYGVDQAEDGGGGADAQGQGQNGGQREGGTLAQLAYGKAKVLQQLAH